MKMVKSNFRAERIAHDPYTALRRRDYRLLLVGNVIGVTGGQMQTVAVGWEIYERTRSPLALGLVGLVQVVPLILLSLLSGHVADRFARRRIIMIAEAVMALAALGLWLTSARGGSVMAIYGCLLLSGTARAFQVPARAALLPQIVPREAFANAVTWSTGGFQLASVVGPALGGLLIAVSQRAAPVYIVNSLAAVTFLTLVWLIHDPQAKVPRKPATATSDSRAQRTAAPQTTSTLTPASLVAGFRFLWRTKIIFAAITLDLFAVLLGGAVALLPMFAKDILQVGARGLGWLLAAPSLGAVVMTILLAHLPPLKRAGRALLWAVAGFGAATIVFGLSRSYELSLLMLFTLGALDQISIVVRSTLVQLLTPDEMRGRVSAVNGMFVGTSNELGGFESGVAAWLFGPVVAVVAGGIGTLIVVLLIALLFPSLRQYGALSDATPEAE